MELKESVIPRKGKWIKKETLHLIAESGGSKALDTEKDHMVITIEEGANIVRGILTDRKVPTALLGTYLEGRPSIGYLFLDSGFDRTSPRRN